MSLVRGRTWLASMVTVLVLPVVGGVVLAGPAVATFGCPAVPYGMNRYGPGQSRTVALTFDDGPGRDTRRIMGILAANHVTATFFNLGVDEVNEPATVRAQQTAGYALGDHTWDHQSLAGLDPAAQAREMDRERTEQAKITGAYPCLFRPPYGEYDATTLALAQERHMRVWDWSVDTEDWKAAGSGDSYWIHRITARAEAGASLRDPVILMHNQPGGNPATVAALLRIIAFYRARGYTFVDLLGNTGPPSIRRILPATGKTAGGKRVVIRGTGFRDVRAARFGIRAGTGLRVLSAGRLSVVTPRHAAGGVQVRVISGHGTSPPISADRFRFIARPAVAGLGRSRVSTRGGTTVTVRGARFERVRSVTFGGVHGTHIRVLSRRRLTVLAPAHRAGTFGVRVMTAYGVSAWVEADQLTFIHTTPPP